MLLLLIAAQAAVAAKSPTVDAKPICRKTRAMMVKQGSPAGAHPLGQEPPADVYRTVLRTVNGCEYPMRVGLSKR